MLSTTSLLSKWNHFLEFCVYHSIIYKNNLTTPLHNQHSVLFIFFELYTNIRLDTVFWDLLFFTPHYVSKCHMLLCLAVVHSLHCCIIFLCENKLSGIVPVFLLQTLLFWIFFFLSPVVMLRNCESLYILMELLSHEIFKDLSLQTYAKFFSKVVNALHFISSVEVFLLIHILLTFAIGRFFHFC